MRAELQQKSGRCTSLETHTARSESSLQEAGRARPTFLSITAHRAVAQNTKNFLSSSAATAAGTVRSFALIAIAAINRATLGRLKWHFCRPAALGAGGRVELAGRSATTPAVAAAITHTATAAATTATGKSGRLPFRSAIRASLGFVGEPAFRIPSLVLARVDEFRTTVRARNVLV